MHCLFYSFGDGDIRSPSTDDGSSPEILLEKPFIYFGHVYQKTHVNNNGHLTFDGPFSQSRPSYLQTQINREIIAPLWTDMDNRFNGTISYRQVTSGGLLLAASNNINQYFPNLNFTASWLFIATWDKVPYFASSQSESTFQVVLVSGKNMSFTLMHYGHITPITYRFMSGYDTSDSTDFFLIPVSDITKLSNTSNVNVTGRWVFRVDRTSDHNDLFYPFGNEDIKNPSEDDGSSPVILLEKPFVYFGRVHRKTYVNNNGDLTFDGPLSQPKPSNLQSQLNRDIIAPLWTDMDNTVSGTISYRQVTSGRLLLAATNNINQYFPYLNFTASWLFIATWDKVPYYNNLQSSSSYQLVLVSGGSLSFVLMNYGNISSTDHRFQAGYGTLNSKNYFSIPVPDENKLFNSSNVNVSGRWAFRVDGGPEEGIFYPYGNEDTKNPAKYFGSSPLIPLAQPFVYFGLIYNQLHVNNKGYLTFNEPFSQSYPNSFPAYSTRDIIAPLWTNIDITNKGTISYRQVTDSHLLNRASKDINQYYPNLNFSASWVFIATWDKVPYFINRRTSTFQVVLVSGKNMSFTLMHYGNIGPTYYVNYGYDTSDSTDFFSIPVSDVTYLSYTSNVNITGRWVFRVDYASDNNGLFYPFRNGRKLNLQQYGFSELYLQTPFSYFGLTYRTVYVYKNGFLTFNWPLFPSSPPTLPANIDIVAPLWTDIDNSDVYFQEFKGVRVLQRVTNDM
ncbi:uncharacterized protein LOC109065522 [Cyprinus carpio]|uniref:Uncharacterized protein LOC109065522 n=1 Tax=Cyprinus carpio TaxID=7962 RepID=A0A9Q9YPV1_CYPCA|nr:uncharacterized protein LOC109065522 [Cyprinus carpio]